ncbi:hypothetical protein CK203_052038 [Vitis vinifera]|uniref:Retrotransposon gag domain-containing protein n=1 Tax=Vitis vinifera TaxID=29760 RepID=A0A438GR21_VITVI|nr:hypothetical protein CK203_052038 [Vitis vinifera]
MQGEKKGERKNRVKKTEDKQLQSSYALLEHFPKSIFYILYTISKLRKSRIQCFKRLFVQCYGIPPEATRYMPQAGTLRTSSQPNSEDFPQRMKAKLFVSWSEESREHQLDTNQLRHQLGMNQNGAVAGGSNLESNGAIATATARDESNGAAAGMVPLCIVHAILNTIAEEAMNFMSYVAEVSRGWDEPNARDMGRMMSQPKAKGEMYILNDGMDMKTEIAAMERRLEELEMNQMQEAQAISQTPLQAMPCAICLSYEHLVEECPTIPAEREMFGDCNTTIPIGGTIQISLGNHSRLSTSNMFKHFRKPQTLNKLWMDEMQNDMAQKLDILQDSISRLANLNTMQEKENSPSQPYQNSMSIHEMEAKEGESSMVKEIEEVITLRSGKEVDLPTCKLEYKVESETEKERGRKSKERKRGKA